MKTFSTINTNSILKAFVDNPNIPGTEGFPNGTIREWKGGKYVKKLGKWFPYIPTEDKIVEKRTLSGGPIIGDPKKVNHIRKVIEKLNLPYKVIETDKGFQVVSIESDLQTPGSEELNKYALNKEVTITVEKLANRFKEAAGSDWEDFDPKNVKPLPFYNLNLYPVIIPDKGAEKEGNGTAILLITASKSANIKFPSIEEFTSKPAKPYPNGIEIAKVENFHIKPKNLLDGINEAKEALTKLKIKLDESKINLVEKIKDPKFASALLGEVAGSYTGPSKEDLWYFLERKYGMSENDVKAFNITYTIPDLFNNYTETYTLFHNGKPIAKLEK